MINIIAILLGIIVVLIGIGTIVYPPLARLINFPGDDRIKGFAAIIIGIIIIVVGFKL